MQPSWCDAPIHVEVRPSRLLTVFHLLSHGGALVALGYAVVPPLPAVVCGLLVVGHGLLEWRREWHQAHPRRVRRLVSLPGGGWEVVNGAGEAATARLLPGGLVHPWVTVLAFRVAGEWRPRGVVLTPDNTPARAFRRLRVRLLLAEKTPATPDGRGPGWWKKVTACPQTSATSGSGLPSR
ncbi:MAG: protein YgfX [Gammaproteobacteria bacterium]|nr:protein YgfX [Gammaproteobacteria bacterium]